MVDYSLPGGQSYADGGSSKAPEYQSPQISTEIYQSNDTRTGNGLGKSPSQRGSSGSPYNPDNYDAEYEANHPNLLLSSSDPTKGQFTPEGSNIILSGGSSQGMTNIELAKNYKAQMASVNEQYSTPANQYQSFETKYENSNTKNTNKTNRSFAGSGSYSPIFSGGDNITNKTNNQRFGNQTGFSTVSARTYPEGNIFFGTKEKAYVETGKNFLKFAGDTIKRGSFDEESYKRIYDPLTLVKEEKYLKNLDKLKGSTATQDIKALTFYDLNSPYELIVDNGPSTLTGSKSITNQDLQNEITFKRTLGVESDIFVTQGDVNKKFNQIQASVNENSNLAGLQKEFDDYANNQEKALNKRLDLKVNKYNDLDIIKRNPVKSNFQKTVDFVGGGVIDSTGFSLPYYSNKDTVIINNINEPIPRYPDVKVSGRTIAAASGPIFGQYYKLKGIGKAYEAEAVKDALDDLGLNLYTKRTIKEDYIVDATVGRGYGGAATADFKGVTLSKGIDDTGKKIGSVGDSITTIRGRNSLNLNGGPYDFVYEIPKTTATVTDLVGKSKGKTITVSDLLSGQKGELTIKKYYQGKGTPEIIKLDLYADIRNLERPTLGTGGVLRRARFKGGSETTNVLPKNLFESKSGRINKLGIASADEGSALGFKFPVESKNIIQIVEPEVSLSPKEFDSYVKVYHATSKDLVPKIFNEGLQPSTKTGVTGGIIKHGLPYVSTGTKADEVIGFGTRKAFQSGGKISDVRVLEANIPKSELDDLLYKSSDKSGVNELRFKEIPGKYIKAYEPDDASLITLENIKNKNRNLIFPEDVQKTIQISRNTKLARSLGGQGLDLQLGETILRTTGRTDLEPLALRLGGRNSIRSYLGETSRTVSLTKTNTLLYSDIASRSLTRQNLGLRQESLLKQRTLQKQNTVLKNPTFNTNSGKVNLDKGFVGRGLFGLPNGGGGGSYRGRKGSRGRSNIVLSESFTAKVLGFKGQRIKVNKLGQAIIDRQSIGSIRRAPILVNNKGRRIDISGGLQ